MTAQNQEITVKDAVKSLRSWLGAEEYDPVRRGDIEQFIQIADLIEKIAAANFLLIDSQDGYRIQISNLRDELARVQAERDAAVNNKAKS